MATLDTCFWCKNLHMYITLYAISQPIYKILIATTSLFMDRHVNTRTAFSDIFDYFQKLSKSWYLCGYGVEVTNKKHYGYQLMVESSVKRRFHPYTGFFIHATSSNALFLTLCWMVVIFLSPVLRSLSTFKNIYRCLFTHRYDLNACLF